MSTAHHPGAIPLFDSVDLVTFDTFGTLIDWRQALPALGLDLDKMPTFLRESERRQRPDRRDFPFVPYRTLLAEVALALRPNLSEEEAAHWARRFGELPFFADVPSALALLSSVIDVGVVSNCDAVHQLDVARRLGRPWDVTVVAEEIGAYKPTDRAWDRAAALVEERGYDRARWLHVSAWDDYDLGPAAARGIRTAYVPRPGGVAPREGAVDATFDDVLQLARTAAVARRGPLSMTQRARASSADVLDRYLELVRTEQLPESRAWSGVRRAELVSISELEAHVVVHFTGRASHQRYLDRLSPKQHTRVRESFSEAELRFETTNGTVLHVL